MKKTQPQLLLESILPEMQEARRDYAEHKHEQEMDECPHDEHEGGYCIECGKDIMDDLVGRAEMMGGQMTAAIVALVGLFGCWVAYRAGYERGREAELNKAAERYERMSRFYETRNGKMHNK